jgi:hypothetical protein
MLIPKVTLSYPEAAGCVSLRILNTWMKLTMTFWNLLSSDSDLEDSHPSCARYSFLSCLVWICYMGIVSKLTHYLIIHTYLLDGMLDYIAYDGNMLFLAKPYDASDCLLFDGRIPLWLKYVDTIGNCKIQANCSCPQCHEKCGPCWILLELQQCRSTFRKCHRAIDNADWNILGREVCCSQSDGLFPCGKNDADTSQFQYVLKSATMYEPLVCSALFNILSKSVQFRAIAF